MQYYSVRKDVCLGGGYQCFLALKKGCRNCNLSDHKKDPPGVKLSIQRMIGDSMGQEPRETHLKGSQGKLSGMISTICQLSTIVNS